MNATEINHARLNRIKIVSRVVRIPLFAMFLYLAYISAIQVKQAGSGLFQLMADLSMGVPIYLRPLDLLAGLIQTPGIAIIATVWFWKLAKLFHFYGRGLVFSFEAVRCIKILGLLCAAQWMLGTIHQFAFNHYSLPLLRSTVPPEVKLKLSEAAFQSPVGVFSIPIWNINFGLLITGIIIVIIAWIMDEGRKIQEEQELTV